MKHTVSVFLKGLAMGAANVIPGVSGGTVAFVSGIYERLISAIKSCDQEALRLLFKGRWRELAARIDFSFLAALGTGVAVGILTLAQLLKILFKVYPIGVWAFFFGLIVASIFFVGRRIKRWSPMVVVCLVLGIAIAVGISLLSPASQDERPWYLFLCGIAGMSSMIVPGISGSFVLLLMGNYQLIMIESISELASGNLAVLKTLVPVGLGAIVGLLALSHFLSWIFRAFHNEAVGLLTGFVAGSLLVIWPWKVPIMQTFTVGEKVKEKVIGYDWNLPDLSMATLCAVLLMIAGALLVLLLERAGAVKPEPSDGGA
jgi:putative membrane protein